jgi:hypothetical protein
LHLRFAADVTEYSRVIGHRQRGHARLTSIYPFQFSVRPAPSR